MNAIVTELGAFGFTAVAAFGLLVGSFINVVIHRLPRGESIVTPQSHCPACGVPIRMEDNIPVVSWLLLRGRCRECRAPISIRYPAVELANATLWLLWLWRAPTVPDFLSGALLCSACLALFFIDADFQILPDAITLPGLGAGLLLSFFSSQRTPWGSAVGAAAGAGSLIVLRFAYEKLKKVEGMGLGDVKMLGMIGAFLGPGGVLLTVLIASISGSVVGLTLAARGPEGWKTRLPFGIFLALGAIATLFFGAELVERYQRLWPTAA